MRVPSFPGEYYAVETYDGQFKVFTTGSSGSEVVPGLRRQALLRSGGAELPLSQANLFELSASYESGSADGWKGWTVGVVDLRFPSR